MFETKYYKTVDTAANAIWNFIREFSWSPFDSTSRFTFVHSVNQEETINESITFHHFFDNLIDFLRDLDAQEGLYCDNEEGPDFDESIVALDRVYDEIDKKNNNVALAGEGFLVIKNMFAAAPGEFPFIVIKPSLYMFDGREILARLKNNNLYQEYTAKAVPALYIQMG